MVYQPSGAAVGGIRAQEADGFCQALHGMALAVTISGDATHMALASGLELVMAQRTHNMAIAALHAGIYLISICININHS
jgi:hypothetical protein